MASIASTDSPVHHAHATLTNPERVQIAVNQRLVNKTPPDDLTDRAWRTVSVTARQLAQHIRRGHAIAPLHKGARRQENFTSAQHIALDFDGTLSLDALRQHPLVADYGALVHTTASHTESEPHCRAIFLLDTPITDAASYRQFVQILLERFPQADQRCSDPSRLYFGATGCTIQLVNDGSNRLPVSLLTAWAVDRPEPIVVAHPEAAVDEHVARQIAEALGVTSYDQSGFSHAVHCPFHDDEHPSAAWHGTKNFLYCFACGQSFSAKETARQLGLEWRSTTGTRGLPNAVREKLLQDKQTVIVRGLEVLYHLYGAGEPFRSTEAVKQLRGFHMAQKSAYQVLAWLREQSWYGEKGVFSPIFQSTQLYGGDSLQNGEKNTPGRPASYYVLPEYAVLAAGLGVKPQGSDVLPVAALNSSKAYRQHLHYAFLKRVPGRYSRQQLGERLGVSGRTLSSYEKDFPDLRVIPTYRVLTPITDPDGIQGLPECAPEARELWGGGVCIRDAVGNLYPPNRSGALAALHRTREASLVTRSVNFYYVHEEGPLFPTDILLPLQNISAA